MNALHSTRPVTLASFGTDLRVAVIGASGGIGGAFVEALAACPAVSQVFALSRTPIDNKGLQNLRDLTKLDGLSLRHCALSGVLIVVAFQLIRVEDIRRTLRATRSDAAVMMVTARNRLLSGFLPILPR